MVKTKVRKYIGFVFLLCLLFIDYGAQAQLESLSTQYMQSQLMINPAYAGTHNSFAIFTSGRHQWMGIEGAPRTYEISGHAPINKSRVSVGGNLYHYSAGPTQINELSGVYAYLLRLNDRLLLSLGLSAGVNYYSISSSDLVYVDQDDPGMLYGSVNKIKPEVGFGGFLYGPNFYAAISVPRVLDLKYQDSETAAVYTMVNRHYYITAGYGLDLGKALYLKTSFLYRYAESADNLLDVNLQAIFEEKFWVGASYRFNEQLAFLFGVRMNKSMSFAYSYDMGLSTDSEGINKNTHEVSLSLDFYKMIRRNRDRMFRRKKKKDNEEDSMRSIRNF